MAKVTSFFLRRVYVMRIRPLNMIEKVGITVDVILVTYVLYLISRI